MATNKSDQSAGDNSIVIASAGNVQITTGLSVSDVQMIVHGMLKESLSGLQQEARAIAEARNEDLLSDFLTQAESRFGERLEERLGRFSDPGAQIAFRHAQLEYCKYGSEDTKQDAIELIISRFDEAESVDEKIIFDEAVQRAGRVNKRQLDFLCFQLLAYPIRDNKINSLDMFFGHLRRLGGYVNGFSASDAELAMLSSLGLAAQFQGLRTWLKFEEIIRLRYPGLLMKGIDPTILAELSPIPMDLLATCLRDKGKIQCSHVDIDEWKRKVHASNMPDDKKQSLVEMVEGNIMSAEEVWAEVIRVEPAFLPFDEQLRDDESVYRGLRLTPVGKAVALARLRRDGWRPDVQLKHLL